MKNAGFLGAVAACLLSIGMAGAEPMTVADTDGRSIRIDLLEVVGDKVTFEVEGKRGEHELAIDRFDEASQKSIREAAKTLKPRYPKLSIDVTIGKKRDKGSSYYMVTQKITSKVLVKNLSRSRSLGKTKATIIFIGRERSTGDYYKILAKDKFEISVRPQDEFVFTPETFLTQYDSDRRGAGNIGGYQYDSYVIALLDDDGGVITHKTSDPSIRALFDSHLPSPATVVAYPVDTLLDENLAKVANPNRLNF